MTGSINIIQHLTSSLNQMMCHYVPLNHEGNLWHPLDSLDPIGIQKACTACTIRSPRISLPTAISGQSTRGQQDFHVAVEAIVCSPVHMVYSPKSLGSAQKLEQGTRNITLKRTSLTDYANIIYINYIILYYMYMYKYKIYNINIILYIIYIHMYTFLYWVSHNIVTSS